MSCVDSSRSNVLLGDLDLAVKLRDVAKRLSFLRCRTYIGVRIIQNIQIMGEQTSFPVAVFFSIFQLPKVVTRTDCTGVKLKLCIINSKFANSYDLRPLLLLVLDRETLKVDVTSDFAIDVYIFVTSSHHLLTWQMIIKILGQKNLHRHEAN